MTLRLTIITFAVLSCMRVTASQYVATEDDTIQVKYHLNPIVVTATKIAHSQRDIAASISSFGEHAIAMAPSSAVLEIIQHRVPSLYVTEWGVMGFGAAGQAAGKISIRGMGGGANTHVLILRNGRPDFMGLMGCTIADEFSSDGVERVEVIRGPGSFLYGTNATGGVINIIPKKMRTDGYKTRIGGGYGAFNTRKYSVSHGGKQGPVDYYITASQRQTAGHRAGSDYDGRHLTTHLGYQVGSNTSLELNANLADMLVRDPGPVTNPASDNWYDILRWGGDLTAIHASRLGETNLKLHGNFGKHKFFDGWRSRDRTLGLMFYHNAKPWHGNTTTVGFDLKRYGGTAVDAQTDYGDIYITEHAPYIHTQQLLLRRVIISGGLRLEHHELFGSEILPKIGLVIHVSPSTSVRISAAKGFRSPSIRELYFWMPANEALTPDRVWNNEIGLTQQIGERLHIEAAIFRMEGSNLIQLQAPPPKWVNSGAYTHTGYEITGRWIINQNIESGGSWSSIAMDKSVFNIPGKKLTAYVNADIGRLTCAATLLWIQDLTGADFPGPSPQAQLHPMDDYAVLNLTVKTRLFSFAELKLDLKNATDARYQSMYGYPMPGRYLVADLVYLF